MSKVRHNILCIRMIPDRRHVIVRGWLGGGLEGKALAAGLGIVC